MNSGGSRNKLVTDLHGVYWTGYDLPARLRSLSLEGVNFAHAERGGVKLLVLPPKTVRFSNLSAWTFTTAGGRSVDPDSSVASWNGLNQGQESPIST